MHKDELIQMHTLLCQLKNYFELNGAEISKFEDYKAMNVSPLHVHRSKSDHKRAIFTLGKELAEHVSTSDLSNPAKVSHRMASMAGRIEKVKVA